MSRRLRCRKDFSQREQVRCLRSQVFNVTNLFCVLANSVVWSLCRFSVALEQFLDSLQMVKNKITPGKLTWPLTKEIVKETQPEYFKVRCLFPLF